MLKIFRILLICLIAISLAGCKSGETDIPTIEDDQVEKYTLMKRVILSDGREYDLLLDNEYANSVDIDISTIVEIEHDDSIVTYECPRNYYIRSQDMFMTPCEFFDVVSIDQYRLFGFKVVETVNEDSLIKNIELPDGSILTVMRYHPSIVCVEGGIVELITEDYIYTLIDPCPLYFVLNGEFISQYDVYVLMGNSMAAYNKLGVGKITRRINN